MGTDEFSIINQWLGWGDPQYGLWFIGIEEGDSWECKSQEDLRRKRNRIRTEFSGKSHTSYPVPADRGWEGSLSGVRTPVFTVTAKIASLMSDGKPDWRKYRDEVLWVDGYGVFNGNLLSLGKPNLRNDESAWPEGYKELFGFAASDYSKYYDKVREDRYRHFKRFVQRHTPQAIVCYGKTRWNDFKKVFVNDATNTGKVIEPRTGTAAFDEDKVILTRHFSNGMPDSTVRCIGEQLKKWGVTIK